MKYLAYFLLSCMAWGQAKCKSIDWTGWRVSGLHVNYDDCTITGTEPIKWGSCEVDYKEPIQCDAREDATPEHKKFHCFIKPEPMDVPAIKESKRVIVGRRSICDDQPQGKNWCSESELDRRPIYGDKDVWTCKKGSHRILLQDVDGDWHCIKFAKD